MGFFEKKIGIPLINGGPKRLAKLIGESNALDLVISKREINASEAKNYGISTYVTTEGGCMIARNIIK